MAKDLVFRIVVKDDGTAVIKKFADGVDDSAKRTRRSAGRMSAAFTRLSTTLKAIPGRIFNIRNSIIGLVVGAGLRNVVNTFVKFERQMNKVAALTGETVGPTFEALEAQARRLGETTVFTANEAADSMAFLAKAGFEANEIMSALPRTLELSAASGIDLGRAADIVTNILTGLRIPMKDLAASNDILVKAFSTTNVNLSQLGESFKSVGPVAVTAGLEFEEVTAAMGLLGNAGLQGSLGGTALRNIIARLVAPSKEAAEILRELGIQVFNTTGKMRPLADIIEQLEESSVNVTKIIKVFGLRAGPGLASLVKTGSAALRELTQELADSGGIAERISRVQMRGLVGALVRMKSAVESAKISIGNELAPTMDAAAESVRLFSRNMTEAIGVLGAMSSETEVLGASFDDFVLKTETIIKVSFVLGRTVTVLNIGIRSLALAASAVAVPFGSFSDALTITEGASQKALDRTREFKNDIIFLKNELLRSAAAQEKALNSLRSYRRETEIAKAATEGLVGATKDLLPRFDPDIFTGIIALSNKLGLTIDDTKLALRTISNIMQVDFTTAAKIMTDSLKAVNESAGPGRITSLITDFKELSDESRASGFAFAEQQKLMESLGETTFQKLGAASEALSQLNQTTRDNIIGQTSFIKEDLDLRLQFIQEAAQKEIAIEKKKNAEKRASSRAFFGSAVSLTRSFVSLAESSAAQTQKNEKKFAIVRAVINTAVGIGRAFADHAWPASLAVAAAAAAAGAAQIAAIASAKPGAASVPSVGGGGGIGGGGQISAAPAPPALADIQPVAQPNVTISVQGFVGNEAELASQIAGLLREGEEDGISVRAVV